MEIIRKYEAADREACVNAFISNVPYFFTAGEVSDFERFLDTVVNKDRDTYYYVLIYDGKVTGSGGFCSMSTNGQFTLAWGLIHKDHHRKGLGEQLLLHRICEIQSICGNYEILIDTTQYSAGFFERFGFVTVKITNDYYTAGLHRYDMVLKSTTQTGV